MGDESSKKAVEAQKPTEGVVSKLSKSAKEVDEAVGELYANFREEMSKFGDKFAKFAGTFIDLANKIAKKEASEEEKTLAKDYLLAQMESVDANKDMDAGKQVIDNNWMRKEIALIESAGQKTV